MNKKSLNQLFCAYIDKFEYLNNDTNCESYKWEAICKFQSIFDLDASDFAAMLKAARDSTENIIDSYTQPFGGLVKLAEIDPEPVREMLRALLVPDNGDLVVRQEKIDAFLLACDRLVNQHFPGSFLYKNDQRSAMAYLFFNDPDNHYLYKATEAKYLADCVGFYDDWGSMAEFKLDIFHRFCDELIAEIKDVPELLATHKSRFENASKPMHPDDPLHILVFDIIYCSHTYDLYNGLSFDKVTSAERKLYQEKKAKAQDLLLAVQKAEADQAMLLEATKYFTDLILSGASVSHKMFGEVDVESLDSGMLTLRIRKNGESKKFGLLFSIANGFVKVAADGFNDKVAAYKAVMLRESDIPRSVTSTQDALQPYKKYLD